jgi:hypothetical protein
VRRLAADRPREERGEHARRALADPARLLLPVGDAHVLRARDDGLGHMRVQGIGRAPALGPQLVVPAAHVGGEGQARHDVQAVARRRLDVAGRPQRRVRPLHGLDRQLDLGEVVVLGAGAVHPPGREALDDHRHQLAEPRA